MRLPQPILFHVHVHAYGHGHESSIIGKAEGRCPIVVVGVESASLDIDASFGS